MVLVIVKNYTCPRCHAGPGQACRAAGQITTANHSERTVAAHATSSLEKRAAEDNAAREAVAVSAKRMDEVAGHLHYAGVQITQLSSTSPGTDHGHLLMINSLNNLFEAVRGMYEEARS